MQTRTAIESAVNAERQALVETLAALVAIPTENPPGRAYEPCVDFFSQLLSQWDVEHRRVLARGGEHPRPSLIGSFGSGDAALHFHGHYDVVAAQSQDQFKASVGAGRMYGRGTADMKGGIVAMLFALRALQRCGARLSGRITFTLTPDEETGGELGIRHLAAEGLLPAPRFGALMPEPSGGAIWSACRGALTLRVEVEGRAMHGALPHKGVNAFERMVGVANSLLEVQERVRARNTAFRISPPEATRSVMLVGGGCGSGASFNIVPDRAWLSIERRLNPEETLAQAKRELEEVFERHRAGGLDVRARTYQESEPSVSAEEAPLGRALAEAVEAVTGREASFELCPGVLETRVFTSRGIPGYSYGPGLLDVSHGPEEYVDLEALVHCATVYALTVARLMTVTSHD